MCSLLLCNISAGRCD
ncbi:hypothetical protein ACQNJN_004744 [Escherichia coli]|nr:MULTISPECIES: hypothetical protein [Enterobacteriaceae]MCM5370582.1 hypothetical protein [Escherichia coli]MCM5388179.1 hypothetical protein [Escherichia coli]MCN5942541.1 hypothetical protein [Escherichia coli]MCN7391270.1 hypothetical protein [Escherichia coli]MCU7692000.1 hypothetical protein [Escherichia coli]